MGEKLNRTGIDETRNMQQMQTYDPDTRKTKIPTGNRDIKMEFPKFFEQSIPSILCHRKPHNQIKRKGL